MKKKIVVGITGASGSIYADRLLTILGNLKATIDLEVGCVLSNNAKEVWQHELNKPFEHNFQVYDPKDYFAPFASGSAQYMDMVVVPCSMGTLGRIANGFSDDLITRSADVILKERRRLILVIRDTPLSIIHIENMLKLTQAGAIVLPAAPSFYSHPKTFEQLADTVVHRVLDLMQIKISTYRWGES